jgi:hypothetical protein
LFLGASMSVTPGNRTGTCQEPSAHTTTVPLPVSQAFVTHSSLNGRDVERSRRLYTEVLGGTTIRPGEPTYVALANSWIIINVGGGPTGSACRHLLCPGLPA